MRMCESVRMTAVLGASRLEALAAVADPGLAEVADGAHQRHACGVAPVRHTAVPTETPVRA